MNSPEPGITFGIYPFPQVAPLDELVRRVRLAEELGFDYLWVADETPMAYPGVISLEAWALLGAFARETRRIRLGTLVSPVAFRHPFVLAMCATTVDHASDGRVVLGVGAGGIPEDLGGVGADEMTPGQLVERLNALLEIVDALLRGETLTRTSGEYRLTNAVVERPIQRPRPPIVVAAQGRRGITVAARWADMWNCLGGQSIQGPGLSLDAALAVVRGQVDYLDEACLSLGRDPTTLRRSVFSYLFDAWESVGAFQDFVGRYGEVGFSDFVLEWPDSRSRRTVMDRVVTDVLPGLRRNAGSGAT